MIIATVDAINADGTLTDHPVSVRQIALADCILVTKLDLLPPDEREARKAALVARLRKYNRTAMIVEPNDLSVDPIQLMRQSVADPTQGSVAAKAWINEALAIGQGQTDVDKHHHDAREAADDRTRVGKGRSVYVERDLGGRRIRKKNKKI